MKKFILALVLVVGLASLVGAAVVVKVQGVKLKTTETINFTTGLTATMSGNDATVAVSAIPTTAITWSGLTAAQLKANTGINWQDVTGL